MSLKWCSRVEMQVNSNSGCILKIDPILFIWHDENGNLQGFNLFHTDNFLSAGNNNFHNSITTKLKVAFLIGKEEKLN